MLLEMPGGYYTPDTGPYSHEDYPGIEIEIYPSATSDEYSARVFTANFDTNIHTFNTEHEAQSWTREQAEIFRRKFLSTNPKLDTMISGKIKT
jgi:hypothetical protein